MATQGRIKTRFMTSGSQKPRRAATLLGAPIRANKVPKMIELPVKALSSSRFCDVSQLELSAGLSMFTWDESPANQHHRELGGSEWLGRSLQQERPVLRPAFRGTTWCTTSAVCTWAIPPPKAGRIGSRLWTGWLR